MKCNYHTHTFRCKHAVGTDEAYVQAALEAGFSVLGFSDHIPWPYRTNFISNIRMSMEEIPDYLASIGALREKYRRQITIRVGFESEYFPTYEAHLRHLLEDGLVEYLILGAHYPGTDESNPYAGDDCKSNAGLLRYRDNCLSAMRTGLFRYIAHPDLFMRHREGDYNRICEEVAQDICQCASECGMPLEYNLLGLMAEMEGNERGYPCGAFWQYAAKRNAQVILGVDAHNPDHLRNTAAWEEGLTRLKRLGISPLMELPLPALF